MTIPGTALVTGSAGFIGFHLSWLLLEEGWRVTGLGSPTTGGGGGGDRAT